MIKKTFFLLLPLIFISVLNAKWIDIESNRGQELFDHSSSGKEHTEINFSLNGYDIETIREDDTDYQKVSYWKEGNSLEVGKPDFPKFTKLISIPNEGTVSFEIIYTKDEIIDNIEVYPTQELQSESNEKPFKFVIDEDYYKNGTVFPANIVEVGEPVIMRDQRVVSVSINPFQYDAQGNTLRIVTNVDIVVNTTGRGGINPKTHDKKISRFFEPLYRSAILNYDSVTERDVEYQDASYLFIYPNDATLLSNLEYLTDWKHQKGFKVTLASTADTGTSTTSIKNYIQDAYDTWEDPPEFVCLVGDATGTYTIPTFFENFTYYNGEGDHPYAQLEGNDILEDVFLGRISISSIADLQTYVAKVLYYEKEPYLDETDWYEARTSFLTLHYSDNDGLTWSDPIWLDTQVKAPWMKFIGAGPGNGIQLRHGPRAGRLVYPIYFTNEHTRMSASLIYSDDHGQTWQRGESPNDGRLWEGVAITARSLDGAQAQLTESQVVELSDGTLKIYMRNHAGTSLRAVAESDDQGNSWGEVTFDQTLTDPICQGTVVSVNDAADDRILFANANSSKRENGTVRLSLDGGKTWPYSRVIEPDSYTYSSLAMLPDGSIGLYYEVEQTNALRFATFTLDWLTGET